MVAPASIRAGASRGRRCLARDARGTVLLEALVALAPVTLGFCLITQTVDLYAHQLMLERAALSAARAAVVVLPDDGARYGDPENRALNQFSGGRKRAIEQFTHELLAASPSFDRASTRLELTGSFAARGATLVQLSSDYRCALGPAGFMCGWSGRVRLEARAELSYQGARYRYTQGG